jgi:Icc protein
MTRTRLALVTDTHICQATAPMVEESGKVLLLDQSAALHALVLDAVQRAEVDRLVHLGDQTCGGGYFDMPADEFDATLRCLHDGYTALGLPVHVLPGNHDCPPGGGGWSGFESLWGMARGTGHTVDLGVARLVLVNAQGHDDAQINAARPDDPVYGWVSDAELARVDAALAEAGARPVVVGIHQLLRPWAAAEPFQDFYLVKNSGAVLEVLARHGNVRAVLQGHAHLYEVQHAPLGGRSVPFIIAPAVIETPLAWLLLEVGTDGLTVELRRLPRDESVARSLALSHGQGWRAGSPAWQRITIPW